MCKWLLQAAQCAQQYVPLAGVDVPGQFGAAAPVALSAWSTAGDCQPAAGDRQSALQTHSAAATSNAQSVSNRHAQPALDPSVHHTTSAASQQTTTPRTTPLHHHHTTTAPPVSAAVRKCQLLAWLSPLAVGGLLSAQLHLLPCW